MVSDAAALLVSSMASSHVLSARVVEGLIIEGESIEVILMGSESGRFVASSTRLDCSTWEAVNAEIEKSSFSICRGWWQEERAQSSKASSTPSSHEQSVNATLRIIEGIPNDISELVVVEFAATFIRGHRP